MRNILRRKRLLVACLLALAIAGGAIAAWVNFTVSGSGGAKAGAAATGTISLVPDAAIVVNTCQPGGNCDLGVDVTNSTSTPGHLLTLTMTGATSSASGCTLPAGTFTINSANISGATLPAGGPSPVVLTNALHLDPAAPVCMAGSTITINGLSGTAGP